MIKPIRVISFLILISFILQISAQEIQFGDNKKEPLTDGPYIFWKESEAVVKYILEDNLVNKSFNLADDETMVFSLDGLEGEFEISRKEKLPEPYIFSNVTKIFALSDVHGQFDRMVQILQNNGIIDADNNWNWQNGHLVILGDVFDRGPKVTESLWLIHKLEKQAEETNGKVHFTLGNHEVMVLQGDERYVHDRYKEIAEKFKMTIPELYGADTEFGRWLRTKNTVIKINDMLFCHAGINPELWQKDYSMNDINNLIRNNLDLPKDKIKEQENLKLLFGNKGPLWYRGYFTDSDYYDQITQQNLWSLLDSLAVSRIIVGHTTQDFINPFFKDRIIPIDSGIKYGDHGEGLLWEDGIFYRAKVNGERERVVF
ncbi:MAG: hypothetical protein B1H06_00325 [Candidatus Cloacimonas sp. 4484_143]|nr:MAG: hypothetical protein B1H06_00325 [Candidatus Cloacimonas sp. 4484_143]